GSFDLVVTDPPFGGLIDYAECADFFYVWMRLVLKKHYPSYFTSEFTPKATECVANKARHGEAADSFYQDCLSHCWNESHRVLRSGGALAFTFHHSEDASWIGVLRSLF